MTLFRMMEAIHTPPCLPASILMPPPLRLLLPPCGLLCLSDVIIQVNLLLPQGRCGLKGCKLLLDGAKLNNDTSGTSSPDGAQTCDMGDGISSHWRMLSEEALNMPDHGPSATSRQHHP